MTIKKITVHPNFLYREFKKILFISFIFAIFQFYWSVFIYAINFHDPFLFYRYFNLLNVSFKIKSHSIFIFFNIYSLYSMLHSFFVMVAIILSYLLRSKIWFRLIFYFSLFPLVGFFFGVIQIPYSLFILKKMKKEEWISFLDLFDTDLKKELKVRNFK